MKKLIFLSFSLIIFTSQLFSQIKYTPMYNPNYGLQKQQNNVQRNLNNAQQHYNENKNRISELKNWINDTKRNTNDQVFINALNDSYKALQSYEGEDLSLYDKQINDIQKYLESETENYNNRLNAQNDPAKYWDAGRENMKKGQFELAIINFNKVLELSPDYYQCFVMRGYAHMNIRQFPEALEDFNKYIQKEFNDTSAYFNRGLVKFYLKDYKGGILDFEKLISFGGNQKFLGYYYRGIMKFYLNDFEGAIKDCKIATVLKPDFSDGYNELAWIKLKQKNFKEAMVDVNKAIDLNDKYSNAYDTRAEIKLNLNDLKGCLSDAQIAIGLNPKLSNSYLLLGRTYYRMGDKLKACENWRKSLDLGDENVIDFISKYCN